MSSRSLSIDWGSQELEAALPLDLEQLSGLVDFLDTLPQYRIGAGELSFVFLSDVDLAQMHGEYCDDPSPTDVITFEGDVDMDFAGEIYVSAERALEEAPRHGHSFAEELTLYLVHGWLHLAGLDDIAETDRAQMRAAEQTVMDAIRSAGKLPQFVWRNVP